MYIYIYIYIYIYLFSVCCSLYLLYFLFVFVIDLYCYTDASTCCNPTVPVAATGCLLRIVSSFPDFPVQFSNPDISLRGS